MSRCPCGEAQLAQYELVDPELADQLCRLGPRSGEDSQGVDWRAGNQARVPTGAGMVTRNYS